MQKFIDSAKKTNRVKQVIVTHKTFCVSTSDGKMAALSATLPAVKGLLWYWLGHGPRQRHEFAHCHFEDKTGQKWPGDGACLTSNLQILLFIAANLEVYVGRNPFPHK